MPADVRTIAIMSPLHEGIIPREEQDALNQMKQSAASLLKQGPDYVNAIVYREWARTGTPKDIAELTKSELSAWTLHLGIGEVPRIAAFECAKLLISIIAAVPSLRYIFDQRGFAHTAEGLVFKAQMEIATSLVPDLTDAEAKSLFGPTATAQDVRDLNVERAFHHEPFCSANFSLAGAVAAISSGKRE
jgi:hypothetical protein